MSKTKPRFFCAVDQANLTTANKDWAVIRLVWGDPASDVWRPLSTDFSDVGGTGVYIVRQTTGPTVIVGQGILKDRLSALQKDGRVLCYDSSGSPLLATWAIIQGLKQTRMLYATQLDGIAVSG